MKIKVMFLLYYLECITKNSMTDNLSTFELESLID